MHTPIAPRLTRAARKWLRLGFAAAVASYAAFTPSAPAPLSPRYTIRIPAPRTPRVGVTCTVTGLTDPSLTLAILYRPAPGLTPTVEAYRIAPQIRRADHTSIPVRLERNPAGNTHLLHVGPTPDGSALGDISIEYELDLQAALGSASDPDAASRIYQDRMVVTDDFATLRGDVLPVPLGHPIQSPRVAFTVPPGWTCYLNAEPRDGGFEFPVKLPPEAASRAVRWLGVAGRAVHRETRDLNGLRVEVIVAPTSADPQRIASTVWDRVAHYARVFGVEPLRYLDLAPLRGIGAPRMMIHALPFPTTYAHRVGGQYLPGTAFFFYDPADLPALGHVVAHEYMHAYNASAMLAAPAQNSATDTTWFIEGYTDVQATLADLAFTVPDPIARLRKARTALVESWALMHDQDPVACTAAILDQPGAHPAWLPTATAPSSSSESQDAIWDDASAYVRRIQGRARLAVFGLAVLLEKSRPRHAAFDEWLRILLTQHAATQPGATAVDDAAIERACQAASGDSAAIADYFTRYIRGTEDITIDDLQAWLTDPALESVCSGPVPGS